MNNGNTNHADKKPKILAIAGSVRKDSFNKKLVRIAAKAATDAGADVSIIELEDFPLPPYDGDLEAQNGLPENAKKLKQLFIESDGFLFASPEYNSSISGTFKNAIDWVSRPEKSDPYYLVAFKGKTAAIMSASPGNLGGLRGLVHLRAILNNIFIFVLPEQVCISSADGAFSSTSDHRLVDEKKNESVANLANSLVTTTHRLKSS